MGFIDPMAFTLAYYHIVSVTYRLDLESFGPVIAGMAAFAPEGAEPIVKTWDTLWHAEVFNRDDIDSADVQRGYQKHTVGPSVRRMFRSDCVQLLSWKGRVRVQQPGSNPDPYLAGFCETFMQAACWVANGLGKPYIPWEPRA